MEQGERTERLAQRLGRYALDVTTITPASLRRKLASSERSSFGPAFIRALDLGLIVWAVPLRRVAPGPVAPGPIQGVAIDAIREASR